MIEAKVKWQIEAPMAMREHKWKMGRATSSDYVLLDKQLGSRVTTGPNSTNDSSALLKKLAETLSINLIHLRNMVVRPHPWAITFYPSKKNQRQPPETG
jgi:hypothetical protein